MHAGFFQAACGMPAGQLARHPDLLRLVSLLVASLRPSDSFNVLPLLSLVGILHCQKPTHPLYFTVLLNP